MLLDEKNQLVLTGVFIVNDEKELLLMFKKNHQHWENPGGKVHLNECDHHEKIELLKKAALREAREEVGKVKLSPLKFFARVEFTIPDGRKALSNKFTAKILEGKPKLMEPEVFEKIAWIPIKKLQNYSLDPTIKLLLKRIQSELG
ncbi:MAG: NUDIX domain-containing protein [archaeon]